MCCSNKLQLMAMTALRLSALNICETGAVSGFLIDQQVNLYCCELLLIAVCALEFGSVVVRI